MMVMLNIEQLEEAQSVIDSASPGDYELKELYAHKWSTIQKPTVFGKAFKETVEAGLLKKIRLLTPKTNNHQTYSVGVAT